MDDRILLVRSLDDLHASINSGDSYRVLRSTAIIRQLFLDRSALVDRVNQNYRERLTFEVVQPEPFSVLGVPAPDVWCTIDTIDPRMAPPQRPRVKKNRDGFFGMVLGVVEGQEYTVRDVVSFVANVMGGVHAGEPRDVKDLALNKVRELRLFSDLSVPLMHLRAIGRIVLEALKVLKYRVLGLDRFEDTPGLSLHLAVALYPMPDEERNFVLDFGLEGRRNRVSVFLDDRGELCLRYYDDGGQTHLVRAGQADCAYTYGLPTYLAFDVGSADTELLLRVECGGWYYAYTSKGRYQPTDFHFVIGSDVTGNARTNMAVMEQCVYSRCLKLEERRQLGEYFAEQLRAGYRSSVRIEGNQFLYSANHPTFVNRG
jgi:hypothetical protein